jgi:hypothetical protein
MMMICKCAFLIEECFLTDVLSNLVCHYCFFARRQLDDACFHFCQFFSFLFIFLILAEAIVFVHNRLFVKKEWRQIRKVKEVHAAFEKQL